MTDQLSRDQTTAAVACDGPLLKVRGLTKHYPIRKGVFNRVVNHVHAVDGVDLDVYPGECLGLVGESGSGKTTVGRCILRAVEPTSGQVFFNHEGRQTDLTTADPAMLRSLRKHMQMIFQDPFSSLNPRLPVGDLISEPMHAHGIPRRQRQQRAAELLERVGLRREHLDRYPHAFSGGQRQRIGIARALALQPRLIVADEPVSALDLSVQAQVLNLLADLQHEFNLTYLFIAHDLSVVHHLCDRVAVMYQGKLVELAEVDDLFNNPQHAYTRQLLAAMPVTTPHHRRGQAQPTTPTLA